jgi:hypothetical protein
MSLIYTPAATATVSANTNSIAIAGMDLATVLPGMVINLGARDRVAGDGYIIASVVPTGTNGGTLTTVGAIPAAFTNAGFVIDTRDFNGTAPNYLIATYTQVLNALLRLTSPLTNLFTGSRQLALDKDNAPAISRLLYAIGGRIWGALEQRTVTYIPAGGAQVTTETLALRAYPDGTTPVDALIIDLATGGADLRKASSTVASAGTTDLGAVPTGKVALTGAATIVSFGVGKHLERLVQVVDGGATLTHNATSLALPGNANIVTAAGDCFHATSDGSGNWRVRHYQRGTGKALVGPPAAEITDASTSGRTVLTGTAAQGATALGLGTGDTVVVQGLRANAGGNSSGAGGAVSFGIGALPAYAPMASISSSLISAPGAELQGDLVFSTRGLGTAGQALTERARATSSGFSITGNLSTTGTATANSVNANAFQLGGSDLVRNIGSNYVSFYAGSLQFITISVADIDKTTYFSNDRALFRSRDLATTFATIAATGFSAVGWGSFGGAVAAGGPIAANQTAKGALDYLQTNRAARLLAYSHDATAAGFEVWTAASGAAPTRALTLSGTGNLSVTGSVGAAVYQLAGATILQDIGSGYRAFVAGGIQILAARDTDTDPSTYYSNNNHVFRSRDYATTFATISAAGIVAAGPVRPGLFTVATLPAGATGAIVYASNARKVGEAAGAGTGVPAYYSNGNWRRLSDDSPVAA